MVIAIPTIRQPQRRLRVLKRLRLLDLIHQNVHRKLTFICAPAGYGKTTLLIDFSEDTNFTTCWYQIDSSDIGLPQFFRHLLVSVREKYPGFGVELEQISFQRTAINPRGLAAELINEFIAKINDFTLLIFDDYHIVSENIEIISFVEYLLEILPDHIRIVIGSRSVYGIPTASLYVNEELAIINADDLRFRASEVRDLARKHFQIRLTNKQADEIIQQADGWIVAILLALRDGSLSIAIPKLEGAREQVYDYLAQEVYERLPNGTKEFLLVTAICHEFTPELANHVLEIKDSDEFIRYLEDQNLFILSIQTDQEVVYQYHQLFKDFLIEQFHKFPQQHQDEIHFRVAGWFESKNDYRTAITHYLQSSDHHQAALIMDRYALSMYSSGQENVLDEWYQALLQPEDLRPLAPDLVLNYAKKKISQEEFDEGLALLSIAETTLEARGDHDKLANLYVTRGMALRFKSDFAEAIELSRFTQAYVAEHQLDQYYAHQAARLEGLGLYHIGKPDQALKVLQNALQGFQHLQAKQPSDRLKHELVMIYADIGFISLAQSKVYDAQRSFGDAVTLCRSMRGNQGDMATSFNNQAYLYFLLGDFCQAWQSYEFALSAAQQVDWKRVIVDILNGQGELLIQIDEFERAEKTLRKAQEIIQNAPGEFAAGFTYLEFSELEKIRGDFNQAMFHLREAARFNKSDFNLPEYQVRLASIYLAIGQAEIASATLEKVIPILESDQNASQLKSLGFFYMADACFRLEQKTQAQEYLQKSLSNAAQLGYDHFLVNSARRTPEFVQTIAEEWQNKHLLTIIKRAKELQTGYQYLISKGEPEEECPDLTLQVSSLGSSEIRVNTEIIPNAAWKSARTKALFYFILDRGKVKRDEIAIEFWPDFSNAKVNSNFHATLWRVRNALGSKYIISFDGNYYSINPQVELFYDVTEYEEILSMLDNPALTNYERRNLCQQAFDMYRGDFLVEIDMPWFDMRRNELRHKNLELTIRFAELEVAQGYFDEARKLYEYAVSMDPYQDQLHLELMKCLVNLKSPAAAKAHYKNYAQILEEELGVEPLDELQEFYNSL
jgi:LuxR family maltose regulon positive regulatory protein